MSVLTQGSRAPDFKLPLMSGGEFSLAEALKKSAVVVAFFKISCPVCQYGGPYYERLAQRLKSAGVTLIGVSQDDRDATADFMKTYGVTFPVALDNKGYPVSNAYGLTNVPTVLEIAKDGVIGVSSVGWSKEDVEAILAKHGGAKGKTPPLFAAGETVADFRAG